MRFFLSQLYKWGFVTPTQSLYKGPLSMTFKRFQGRKMCLSRRIFSPIQPMSSETNRDLSFMVLLLCYRVSFTFNKVCYRTVCEFKIAFDNDNKY